MARRSRFLSLVIVLTVAVGALSSAPAVGDWLVTGQGARIETRGAWEVKGKLVVFHTPKGVFSSLRLASIDLEASTALTEALERAAQAPALSARRAEPAAKPKAKFVLTDADVGHVDPATLPNLARSLADDLETEIGPAPGEDFGRETNPALGDEAEASPGSQAEVSQQRSGLTGEPVDNPLEVVSWDAVLGAASDGVVVSGTVKNPSEYFASSISIEVTLLSLEGDEIERGAGNMAVNALGPGEQGTFRASFPGVFSVGRALFEITSFNALPSR